MKQTRRNFLKQTGMIAAGSLLAPNFIHAFGRNNPAFDHKKLVIIQLSGGNDGLNTIVPFRNDIYYRSRPQIAIEASSILRLNDELGMNPSLAPLASLYDQGLVSVLNNVGYPNPDRSHFRSMDIWHTASHSDEYWDTGWLGRYLDATCANCHSPHKAIEANNTLGLAMRGEKVKGLAMKDPAKLMKSINSGYIRSLTKTEGHSPRENNALDYLYKTIVESVNSADYINEKVSVYRSKVSYPDHAFGKSMKMIAELINSGLETSVYYASLSGFDTHARQKGTQDRLLKIYADVLDAFVRDLRSTDAFDHTLIMTFSEFGRRVNQNASRGTDHGTANNLFLIGNRLKAGLYNESPNLTDLDNGDLKFSIDFRQVYATLLDGWLNADSKVILRSSYDHLDLL